ncbi:MAG: sugar phosphate nucleotidyltransferase [Rubritalea sp.]|uniref:nucleotidyltransferase family protein n=1 Tax=Rubritalea sp. TaxID=2109375 RepID=UPI003241DF02
MSDLHKAFILGAGLGTRLRPLTETLPKPLIPYYHEPLINQALRHCIAAGVDSFAINTHHLAEEWLLAFPDKKFESASLDFFKESVLLETGGGIKNIADWIGDEPLLVYNGDILTNLDLHSLILNHQSSGNVATLALFSDGPNCNVAVEGDKVIDLRHARELHPGTHQFTGIYIIEPEILDLIPANKKISIVPAFLALAEQGKIGAHISDGAQWKDLGTREEYLAAHLDPQGVELQPSIHPSAKIAPCAKIDLNSCFIGPNCVIEKGAKLRNTIVWPSARVAEQAVLDGCIVRTQAEGHHLNEEF